MVNISASIDSRTVIYGNHKFTYLHYRIYPLESFLFLSEVYLEPGNMYVYLCREYTTCFAR